MRTIVITAGLALVLAGCGGGGGDREAVAELFKRLQTAQADNNPRAACEVVFVVQEPWEQAPSARVPEVETGVESPAACQAAFEAGQAAREKQVESLHTTVESVAFDGDTAVARVRSEVTRTDGSTFANVYERDLVRRNGDWRIRISPEG